MYGLLLRLLKNIYEYISRLFFNGFFVVPKCILFDTIFLILFYVRSVKYCSFDIKPLKKSESPNFSRDSDTFCMENML